MKPVIIIPARMASTRLRGKPLADIHGQPMIVHVMHRAQEAKCGPVYIACAEDEIKTAIENAGGTAIMTDPDLPSGTDRVRAAIDQIDPNGLFDVVINLQGDMPNLDPSIVSGVLAVLKNTRGCDIATAVVSTDDPDEIANPNVVKAVLAKSGRALYFTRASAPGGEGPVHHHIGIYAYRRSALNKFCDLPPSPLEKRERLEQLRALEADMRIDAAIVYSSPLGVDTPEDLETIRKEMTL